MGGGGGDLLEVECGLVVGGVGGSVVASDDMNDKGTKSPNLGR